MTPGTPLPPSTRHVRTYRAQGHTVLEFHGEIDIAAALEITPCLDHATGPHEALVVIDLTSTTFIDCSGLGLLCRARSRVVEKRGQLLLVCPHPRTLALLHIVRLCGVFRPYPTLHAALADAAPAEQRAKRRSKWTEGRLACRRSRTRAPS